MKVWFLFTLIRAGFFALLEVTLIHDWQTSIAFFIVFTTIHLLTTREQIDERRARAQLMTEEFKRANDRWRNPE